MVNVKVMVNVVIVDLVLITHVLILVLANVVPEQRVKQDAIWRSANVHKVRRVMH